MTVVGADVVQTNGGNIAVENSRAQPELASTQRPCRGRRAGRVREGSPGTWEAPSSSPKGETAERSEQRAERRRWGVGVPQ